jgi:hypothetical protein
MTHQDPHSKSADAVHEHRPVEAQYVRQGRGGSRIVRILVISVALAAILLLGMWALSQGGFAAQDVNAGHQAVDSAAFDTNAGQAPVADAPTTTTGQPTNPPTGEAPNVNAPNVSATAEPSP